MSRHRDNFEVGPASSPVHMRYAKSTYHGGGGISGCRG